MNSYLLYGVAALAEHKLPWHPIDPQNVPNLFLKFSSGETAEGTSDLVSVEKLECGWSITAGRTRAVVNAETREIEVISSDDGFVARTERAIVPVAGELLFNRSVAYFHASAVAKNGKALAIVGESGAGKSSTGWALHNAGWDHLADDMLAIGPDLSVYPAGTQARLRHPTRVEEELNERDPTTGKYHIKPRTWVRGPLELGAVAVLKRSENTKLTLHALDGAAAVAALSPTPLRFSDDAGHMKEVFSRIALIASEVPVYRVEVPHYDSKMPEHVKALEVALQEIGWNP